jgi:hypothetical protein
MLSRIWYWIFSLVREADPICPECGLVAKSWEPLRQHYHKEHWTPTYYNSAAALERAWENNR